jgi:hypothetical protein
MSTPIGRLAGPAPGPDLLFHEVRDRVHVSVSDESVRAVLVPAVSYIAMLARQSHLDGLPGASAGLSWQDVCDWLVGIVGRHASTREV